MSKCTCKTGLANLQSGDCIVHPGITRKYIFVKYFKADGTVNGIDLTVPFGEAEFDALLNQSDKDLRFYLSDDVSTFVTDRADPNTQDIDGIAVPTSQGVRTMSSEFYGSGADLASKLESNNCSDIGIYLVDEENSINGMLKRDNFLDPIRLARNAFAKIVMPTEGLRFNVSFSTSWGKNVRDGDLRSLTYADHGIDILDKRGLVDVKESDAASVSATTATVRFTSVNGSAKGEAFTGLVFGDFTMFNSTTQLAVAVSASVENPNGTYELTFAAQTAADLGTITATSTGFEFEVASITYL